MKIALASNVTVDMLAGMLREDGHEVWVPAGFGAWLETALTIPDELKRFSPELIAIVLDRNFPDARGWQADEPRIAAEALQRAFPNASIIVPDVGALAAEFGKGFYDTRMWQLAAMPFSLAALGELRKFFGYHKVLAIDLDNTLWDGVVSEDGPKGIRPKTELQREIKALKERGVLLVALSKNNPEDVERVWNVKGMVLTLDDFVASAINWEPKSVNLKRIASELNLGEDAFVFVDDDAANRAEVRAGASGALVATFPPKLEVCFPKRTTTDEDLLRNRQYREETARKKLAAILDYAQYLESLAIKVEVHALREPEVARVAQLSAKANQFNVTTIRRSEATFRELMQDERHAVFTASSSDRFGDLGLIAYVTVAIEGESAELLDWVMSCRAMNRQIEFTIEREVEASLKSRGVRRLAAQWRRSAKNAPVERLFDGFGFTLVDATTDSRKYSRVLS